MTRSIGITAFALALALGLAAPQAQALDKINVSAIKAATFGGLFIAKERGYFAMKVST
jgi:ABC-type nitrate/sulfonate/bicarbonate transport system substrate-binding protein